MTATFHKQGGENLSLFAEELHLHQYEGAYVAINLLATFSKINY